VNFEETESYSDQEKIQIILLAGFSTKEQATEFSGRGIGMDVVKSNIQKLEGTLEISSVLGQGTQFKIKIPNQ
jgi:two-component system chemotaxis sensor kinase CheA